MHVLTRILDCWYEQQLESMKMRTLFIKYFLKLSRKAQVSAWCRWFAVMQRSRTVRQASKKMTKWAICSAWGRWEKAVDEASRMRRLGGKISLRRRTREILLLWTKWCDSNFQSARQNRFITRTLRRCKDARLAMCMDGWKHRTVYRVRLIRAAKRTLSIWSRRVVYQLVRKWCGITQTRRDAHRFSLMQQQRRVHRILDGWKTRRFHLPTPFKISGFDLSLACSPSLL